MIGAIELEVAVEPPDQMAHQGDGGTLRLGHRHQAVDQTLGVDPACDRLSPGKEDDVKTI
jgi:hypothetical protein